MRFSTFSPSRVRLLTLLLVAMFSFAAIGAATIASANDASAAKKKKCKKGYKKVGKKCKKTKKRASSPGAVASVKLSQASFDAESIEVSGSFTTKTAFTGRKTVKYTIVSSAGTETVSQYALGSKKTVSKFTHRLRVKVAAPFEIKAKIDGKTSNILKISN